MSERIILYSSNGCPWAHRARIAVKASGAKFEIVEIDLKNKPDWYPRINPLTKVPAISYGASEDSDPSDPPAGTFILTESALIVDFVASLYPEIDYKDPIARAKANFALFQYDSLVAPHWGKLSRQGNGDVDAFLKGLKEWQQHLPDEALEDEYGVADIKLGPFITRFFIFSENEIGAWSPGTGAEILAGLCDPGLAKFNQFATKLRKWPAITETIDEAKLVNLSRSHLKANASTVTWP